MSCITKTYYLPYSHLFENLISKAEWISVLCEGTISHAIGARLRTYTVFNVFVELISANNWILCSMEQFINMKTQKISKLLNKRFTTPVWRKVAFLLCRKYRNQWFLPFLVLFTQFYISSLCMSWTKIAQGTKGSEYVCWSSPRGLFCFLVAQPMFLIFTIW
jgi:hypothetical protein